MNKKGEIDFLGEETGKILLSALGLIILVGLVVLIVIPLFFSNDVKQAKASLSDFVYYSSNLQSSDKGIFLFESPIDWYMIYFSELDAKPTSCESDRCLCLCSDISDWSYCNNERTGVCQSVSDNYLFNSPTEAGQKDLKLIGLPRAVNVSKINDGINVTMLGITLTKYEEYMRSGIYKGPKI